MPELEGLTFTELREMNLINENELRDMLIVSDFKAMRLEGLTVETIIEICSKKEYNHQCLASSTIRDIVYKKGVGMKYIFTNNGTL